MEWEEAKARLEGLAQSKPPVIDVSGGKFYADIRAVLQRLAELERLADANASGVVAEHERAEAAEARVSELEKQLEDVFGMDPCPKCGQGISATCLGCEIKRLEGLILDSEIDFQAGLRAEARRIREREAGRICPACQYEWFTHATKTCPNAHRDAASCPCGDGPRPGHPSGWCGQREARNG